MHRDIRAAIAARFQLFTVHHCQIFALDYKAPFMALLCAARAATDHFFCHCYLRFVLSVVDPVTAGLKEGRNAERERFLPCPQIQIVTKESTKTPSNLSSQKFARSLPWFHR